MKTINKKNEDDIVKKLNDVLEQYKYELNTKELREEIKNKIDLLINSNYFGERDIFSKFSIKLNDENNKPEDVDKGIINVDLDFQFKNAPEFINIHYPLNSNFTTQSNLIMEKYDESELNILIEKYLESNL